MNIDTLCKNTQRDIRRSIMNTSKIIKVLPVIILVTLLFNFGASQAKADWDMPVTEIELIVDGKHVQEIDGADLSLNEGSHVQLTVTLRRAMLSTGTIVVVSDLVGLTGLTRFDIVDYIDSEIPVVIEGTVPPALVPRGDEIHLGERSFILITILCESNPSRNTLLNLNGIATNNDLRHSQAEVTKTANLIETSPKSPTQALAYDVLDAAVTAWSLGNPYLAILLTDITEDAIKTDTYPARSKFPGWGIAFLVIFGLAAIIGWSILMGKRLSSKNRPDKPQYVAQDRVPGKQ